jgi:hypothetical protein
LCVGPQIPKARLRSDFKRSVGGMKMVEPDQRAGPLFFIAPQTLGLLGEIDTPAGPGSVPPTLSRSSASVSFSMIMRLCALLQFEVYSVTEETAIP